MIQFVLYILIYSFLISFSLFLGLYVLILSPKERTHQLFFLSVLIISITDLFLILFHIPKDMDIVWLIMKIGTSLIFVLYYLILLFIIYLTRAFKLIKVSYLVLVLCLISIIITMNMECYYKFIRIDYLLFLNDIVVNFGGIWLNNIYYSIVFLLYIIILLYSVFKTKLRREKIQYFILISTLFLNTALIVIISATAIKIKFYYLPTLPLPIFLTIFLIGCWYSIVKYRFLALTPELVSKDILENINDSIVLLTHDRKIITANTKTKALLNIQKIDGRNLSSIIFDYEKINGEIEKLVNKNLVDFSCRFYYINIENQNILMDARFSIVKDKFDDVLGILLIAKEVKEIKQLKTIYKITEREAEIIENVIMGCSNLEISGKIKVTENTLKRHITNIYNKLGVDNKMQLLSLLKDFNLLPDQKAEKTLILLKKPQ